MAETLYWTLRALGVGCLVKRGPGLTGYLGVWLSLVERLSGGQETAGSNPAIPTAGPTGTLAGAHNPGLPGSTPGPASNAASPLEDRRFSYGRTCGFESRCCDHAS